MNKHINLIDNIRFTVSDDILIDTEYFSNNAMNGAKDSYIVVSHFEDITQNDCLYIKIYFNNETDEDLIYKGHFDSSGGCNWEYFYTNYDIDLLKDTIINKVFSIIEPF